MISRSRCIVGPLQRLYLAIIVAAMPLRRSSHEQHCKRRIKLIQASATIRVWGLYVMYQNASMRV